MPYSLQQTNDGSKTLFSTAYQETFHSAFGALTETEHVFLQGTGVAARLEQGLATRILEVGFGTGLNFLATAYLAQKFTTPLQVVALEKTLLPGYLLRQLNHGQHFGREQALYQTFLRWREEIFDPILNSPLTWTFSPNLRLDLILGEATQVDIPEPAYQAIYHDAFSPTVNPELWTKTFFHRLYQCLAPQGKLATYSAKGTVRRALQRVGFVVSKQPGPPGKRDMVVATKPAIE